MLWVPPSSACRRPGRAGAGRCAVVQHVHSGCSLVRSVVLGLVFCPRQWRWWWWWRRWLRWCAATGESSRIPCQALTSSFYLDNPAAGATPGISYYTSSPEFADTCCWVPASTGLRRPAGWIPTAVRWPAAVRRLPATAGWLPAATGWLPTATGWLPTAAGWLPTASRRLSAARWVSRYAIAGRSLPPLPRCTGASRASPTSIPYLSTPRGMNDCSAIVPAVVLGNAGQACREGYAKASSRQWIGLPLDQASVSQGHCPGRQEGGAQEGRVQKGRVQEGGRCQRWRRPGGEEGGAQEGGTQEGNQKGSEERHRGRGQG